MPRSGFVQQGQQLRAFFLSLFGGGRYAATKNQLKNCRVLVVYEKMSIEENIQKYGWQYQYVFDEHDDRPSFSYTIGLEESYSHPEIMIFGLKREQMHAILSNIVNDIKCGRVFEANVKTDNVLAASYEVLFKPIKSDLLPKYAGTAERYYNQPFRVYVMLWPDKNNILPTEPGCELTVQDEALEIV